MIIPWVCVLRGYFLCAIWKSLFYTYRITIFLYVFESQYLHRKSLVFKGGGMWNEVEGIGMNEVPCPWVAMSSFLGVFPGFELSAVNHTPGTI